MTTTFIFDAAVSYADWRPPCFGRLALEYATRFGLSVLPLVVGCDQPALRVVPDECEGASRDPATIHAWWSRAPHANVGIACGASGLVVIEVARATGPATLAMHVARLGPLPSTWTARTPTGCAQYFFSHDDARVTERLALCPLGPGVRAVHRGHVLAPPSVLHGRHGAWDFDKRPGRTPLAAMPAEWLDCLTSGEIPPNEKPWDEVPRRVRSAAREVLHLAGGTEAS